MLNRLFLLLCLTGHVFAKEPAVECLVVHLKYVNCYWNQTGAPEFNYTFYAWFHNDKTISECPEYLLENSKRIGCNQPYPEKTSRFYTFKTKLVHGSSVFEREHELKTKVKLYPPFNLTAKLGPDSNLWFYWNQSFADCVENDIQYRINGKQWRTSRVSSMSHCINLPSSSSLYELQARSKLAVYCGDSFWSEWSEIVVWRSNNSTDINPVPESTSVWTTVVGLVCALALIILVMILLHHERVRIIIMPMVPKPSHLSADIQDWLQRNKGLKESFHTSYNERVCPVREYCHVSQSDTESTDSSTSSVTTDQTDCSITMPVDKSDLSGSCSSSTSSVLLQSSEVPTQVAV
ncbi:uncharacterized protein V6R79_012812 [Siganus canaliculatus]